MLATALRTTSWYFMIETIIEKNSVLGFQKHWNFLYLLVSILVICSVFAPPLWVSAMGTFTVQ